MFGITVFAGSVREHGVDNIPTKHVRRFARPQQLSLVEQPFNNDLDHHFDTKCH